MPDLFERLLHLKVLHLKEIPPGKCILAIKKYKSNKEMVHNGGEDLYPKNLRKHNNLEL